MASPNDSTQPLDLPKGLSADPPHEGPTNLQMDADLTKRHVVAQAEKPSGAAADLFKSLGSEADFLRDEPGRMRQQFGAKGASSEELFHKIAQAGFAEFKHSSRQLQNYELKQLGLTRENISPQSIFDAQMAQRVKELGVSDPHNYAEIELKMNKKFYADVKAGKVGIDYD